MLSELIKKYEFMIYTFIGGFATLLDWLIFGVATRFGLHYEIALGLAYFGASILHYTANKFITFQCQSKSYRSQISIYIIVVAISLLCSMAVMAGLVHWVTANKMVLRIITTIIMLIPNYLLHKYITFNEGRMAQLFSKKEPLSRIKAR
jgi:putative flippase GtrA